MYGGLFGDLPAAKNVSNKDEVKSEADPPTKRQAVETPTALSNVAAASSSSSLVRNLGATGTSMAFVPAAALQRKRNVVKKPPVAAGGNASGSSATTRGQVTRARSPSENQQVASWEREVLIVSKKEHDKFIHNPHNQSETAETNFHPSDSAVSAQAVRVQEKEPEEIRKLHESCAADPDNLYNPLVPNDLLQYLQKKQAMMERQELEREAREALAVQETMRQQLEQERKELQKTGDVNKIVEHRQLHNLSSAERGRGRGISNLPAWLVEKQRKEAEQQE